MTAPRARGVSSRPGAATVVSGSAERTGGVVADARADRVIAAVYTGFERTGFPGGPFLQGSFDGCEPAEEVGPFTTIEDWRLAEPALLDAHYCALSFFSEGGFRFFIPAYMVADLRGQLLTADPVFHLTHGFSVFSYSTTVHDKPITHRSGGDTLLNPRRYGAMTWEDSVRHRMSVFTREEVGAIIEYLTFRRTSDDVPEAIDAALDRFWRPRAESAPTADMLAAFLAKP